MDEKVRQVVRDYDATHPKAQARAQRAREDRRRAEQRLSANNSKAWCDWLDQRIEEHIEQHFGPLHDALGELLASARKDRDKAIKAAVEETKR